MLTNNVTSAFFYLKLTGKKSLWEAQGLKSFFHSAAFSLGKLMEYTVKLNLERIKPGHDSNWNTDDTLTGIFIPDTIKTKTCGLQPTGSNSQLPRSRREADPRRRCAAGDA